MLIIEGTDGLGKTTLCGHLLASGTPFGPVVYRRLGLLPGNWNYYDDYVNRMLHLQIQDRFFLSEYAYGPVCRGGTPLTLDMIKRLSEQLDTVGGVTLVITADDEIIRRQFENRPDELYKLEQVLKVNERFIKVWEELGAESIASAYMRYHMGKDDPMPSQNEDMVAGVQNEWFNRLNEFYGE